MKSHDKAFLISGMMFNVTFFINDAKHIHHKRSSNSNGYSSNHILVFRI